MVKESGSSKPGNRFLRTDAAATERRTGAEAGAQLEVTASLGAGGVDTRTSGLGDRHCWNTAAWQGPAGGGAGSGGSTIRALSGLGHEIGDSPQAPGGAEAGREKSRPPSDGGLAWENLLSLLGRLAVFLQYGKK